jgi:hypothetical protein
MADDTLRVTAALAAPSLCCLPWPMVQVLGPAVGQPAQGLYNPGTQLTFRDFCEVLVRLAAARYPMLHSLEAQLQQVITYHLLPLLGGAARPATAAGRGSSAATAAAAAAASSNDAVGGCEQLLRSSEVLQYLHEHAALLQQLFAAVLDRGRLEVPFVPSDSMGGSAEDEQQQQQQLDCDTAGPSAPCTAPDAAAACSAAASHVRQVLAALQFGGVLEHWQLSADAVTACLLHCSVAGVDPQGARCVSVCVAVTSHGGVLVAASLPEASLACWAL